MLIDDGFIKMAKKFTKEHINYVEQGWSYDRI